MVSVNVVSGRLEGIKEQCIVLAFFEDRLKLEGELAGFDSSIGNAIASAIKNKDFNSSRSGNTLYGRIY